MANFGDMKEALENLEKIWGNVDGQKLRDQYKCQHETVRTVNAHRIITGKAYSTLKAVAGNGGTQEEINLALANLMICMDAYKHNLDFRKFQADNKIDELRLKYIK